MASEESTRVLHIGFLGPMDDHIATGYFHRVFKGSRDAKPVNLLVRIESLSLLTKYEIDTYESRAFESRGYKWKVTIYQDNHDCVSAYLAIVDTHLLPVGWEEDVTNLIISGVYPRCFNVSKLRCELTKLISRERLMDGGKGYVMDDECLFGAEVEVSKGVRINDCMSVGDVWSSDEIHAQDYKWKVVLYPRGNPSLPETSNYVSLFLETKDFPRHRRLKVLVVFRIRNKISGVSFSSTYSIWFTSSCKDWGFKQFISTDRMSSERFLARNTCLLGFRITMQAEVCETPIMYSN
ncbi:uncharacterized protein LOC125220664 [Salvia hispanica]|uniref:uncharacterized protein LOC125220664 n=1 Tax=Salvia hispanica TaxID=49212 RepID=UPI0020093B32|nr:uncharacterized protein LOC125220664 [Salvia hispanica]